MANNETINNFYDESYFGPGVVILSSEGATNRLLKISSYGELGFPKFSVRAYEDGKRDDAACDFTTINFVIEKGSELYDIFFLFSKTLNGDKLYSCDPIYQGKSYFEVKENKNNIVLSVNKDVYGVKNSSDYIDITLGDNDSCKHYEALWHCYNQLAKAKSNGQIDIIKMIQKKK